MLFPTCCPVCGRAGPAPCRACRSELVRADGKDLQVPGLDVCAALYRYEGGARRLVTAVKYRNNRAAVGWLGAEMATLARRLPAVAGRAGTAALNGTVTWAPTTSRRRRERGYDQAELLAQRVAAELGLPCRALLRRVPGPSLTGRRSAARAGSVAFVARAAVTGGVLLVDDVVTTGATLAAAAAVLGAAGAAPVVGLTAAWTPPPSEREARSQRPGVGPTTA